MSISAILPAVIDQNPLEPGSGAGSRSRASTGRARRGLGVPFTQFGPASFAVDPNTQRQAELFYLQKQIHSQTPMVIVLEDGERVEGVIEWYDRNSIKVRGRAKCLIFKSAIKYMFKLGEGG
jgi:sRNA-binding regulator protein Hfq